MLELNQMYMFFVGRPGSEVMDRGMNSIGICKRLPHTTAIFIARMIFIIRKQRIVNCSGVGGIEAMLFTSELVDMYRNFAAFKG